MNLVSTSFVACGLVTATAAAGECRRDWSNERFFTGPRPDDRRDHQNTALVGLVWWFGNKQGAW